MNRAAVQRIADAVLYEGYILYPYRPSVKNTLSSGAISACPLDPVNPVRYRTFGSPVTRNASTSISGSRSIRFPRLSR